MATPNAASFLTFVRNVMGISATWLPDNSPSLTYAFDVAMMVVNPVLANAGSPADGSWSIYELAVYNLGGDNLVNFAPDQTGQNFFANLRQQFNIAGFKAGVVSSASDQGTAESLEVAKSLATLTVADLQNLKTPWGRAYLGFAQSFGTAWGLS